jgi:hypothetical protein
VLVLRSGRVGEGGEMRGGEGRFGERTERSGGQRYLLMKRICMRDSEQKIH